MSSVSSRNPAPSSNWTDVSTAWNGSGDESKYDRALFAKGTCSDNIVDGEVSGGIDTLLPFGAANAATLEKVDVEDSNAINGEIRSG